MADRPAACHVQSSSRFTRRHLAGVFLFLLLVPLIRLGALRGLVRPVRIVGGSMAGSYYGPHYPVRCADCSFVFRCGAEYLPVSRVVVCPNCGFAENRLESTSGLVGKRVVIDRWSRWMHSLRPWQPVAFAPEDRPDYLAIKRLVPSGNGQLEVRDGDLFVGGKIQRKSLEQFRQICVLVHDDRYRPTLSNGLPDRWRGRHPGSLWQTTVSGYTCAAAVPEAGSTIDWLEYTQWTCWPNPSPPTARTAPTAILDHYAYNQDVSRGGLNQVSDVMLQCELTASGSGYVVLRVDSGGDCFQLELPLPHPVCRLRRNGEVVQQAQRALRRQPWSLEFAVCDQCVWVSVNGRILLQHSYQGAVPAQRNIASTLAIGAAGVRVRFEAPRIYRDIYYLGPRGERQWASPRAAERHLWFVVGDNVPVSIDSRHSGPIDGDSIIGPVYQLVD